jgi:hypothetical protein
MSPIFVDRRRGTRLYSGRMKAMTERQRVLTLLSGGKPDRVPWYGDLDYWATALIGRGERPADFKTSDAYIDWHRELRCGFYLQGYFPFRAIIENCRVEEWREGSARRRRIETPRGTLTETWTWLAESFAEAPTEHLVKSVADLAAYRSLFENTSYEPDQAFARERRRQVGDAGFKFIEAMTPAPVGDLEVGQWADWVGPGNRTVFWGGLPGVYFTEQVSDPEFERHTKAVLEVMRSDTRYVLGVADQVPPDGLERRVRRVAELADEFGRY